MLQANQLSLLRHAWETVTMPKMLADKIPVKLTSVLMGRAKYLLGDGSQLRPKRDAKVLEGPESPVLTTARRRCAE